MDRLPSNIAVVDLIRDKWFNLLYDLLFILQVVVDLLLAFDLLWICRTACGNSMLYSKFTTSRTNGVRHIRALYRRRQTCSCICRQVSGPTQLRMFAVRLVPQTARLRTTISRCAWSCIATPNCFRSAAPTVTSSLTSSRSQSVRITPCLTVANVVSVTKTVCGPAVCEKSTKTVMFFSYPKALSALYLLFLLSDWINSDFDKIFFKCAINHICRL